MRARACVVALACLGAVLGAPDRASAQVAVAGYVCYSCGRSFDEPARSGCHQAAAHGGGGGGGDGGYGGGDPDAALRAAAGELGAALGQALGEALFGGGQAAQQRAWELQQAQAAAEAARLAEVAARLELANRLRSDWDARDEELSRSLSSIFESSRRTRQPRARGPTPVGGPAVPVVRPEPPSFDTSVVDLGGTIAGSTPLPALEAWSRQDALPQVQLLRGPDAGSVPFAPLRPVEPPAIASRWRGHGDEARTWVGEQARRVRDDLLDELSANGPPNAATVAKRLLLIQERVAAFLDVDHLTAIGRDRGEYALDLGRADGVRVGALADASGNDSIESAYTVWNDPSAAGAVLLGRARDEAGSGVRDAFLPWKW